MNRPQATLGMRHVALQVKDVVECEAFYVGLLGMAVEWRPDADNLYLSSGHDNLALHRLPAATLTEGPQVLDHIGFILALPEQVDEWHDYLAANGVEIIKPPKTHRDGARSFYCMDPAGVVVQLIYHPPISESIG